MPEKDMLMNNTIIVKNHRYESIKPVLFDNRTSFSAYLWGQNVNHLTFLGLNKEYKYPTQPGMICVDKVIEDVCKELGVVFDNEKTPELMNEKQWKEHIKGKLELTKRELERQRFEDIKKVIINNIQNNEHIPEELAKEYREFLGMNWYAIRKNSK